MSQNFINEPTPPKKPPLADSPVNKKKNKKTIKEHALDIVEAHADGIEDIVKNSPMGEKLEKINKLEKEISELRKNITTKFKAGDKAGAAIEAINGTLKTANTIKKEAELIRDEALASNNGNPNRVSVAANRVIGIANTAIKVATPLAKIGNTVEKTKKIKAKIDKAKKIAEKAKKLRKTTKKITDTADRIKKVKKIADTANKAMKVAKATKTAAAGTKAAAAGSSVVGGTAGAPIIIPVAIVALIVLSIVTVIIAMAASDLQTQQTRTGLEAQQSSVRATDGENRNIYTNIKGERRFAINMPITTMSLDGHEIPYALDINGRSSGIQGIGYVGLEEHQPVPGHIFGETGTRRTFTDRISFPARAWGLTAEEEIWYINMRWNYVDAIWQQGTLYPGHPSVVRFIGTTNFDNNALAWTGEQRVLVTNLTTGRMVVAVPGDYGPGISSQIGGLSPEVMYYLSNQAGEPNQNGEVIQTPMAGNDYKTKYRFEWIKNPQNYPLGPIEPKDVLTANPNLENTSELRQAIVAFAYRQIGKKYHQNKRHTPGYWDCSSLLHGAYRKKALNGDGNGLMDLFNTKRASTSSEQMRIVVTATGGYLPANPENAKQMLPGDPVFSSSPLGKASNYKQISHVTIYVGNNSEIHAAGSKRGVVKDSLTMASRNTVYWFTPGAVEALLLLRNK